MSHVMNDPRAEQAEVEKRLSKRLVNELYAEIRKLRAENRNLVESLSVSYERQNDQFRDLGYLKTELAGAVAPIAYAHMWEHGFKIHETEEAARAEIAYAFECVEAQGLIEKSPSYLVAVLSVARHAPVMQWSDKL